MPEYCPKILIRLTPIGQYISEAGYLGDTASGVMPVRAVCVDISKQFASEEQWLGKIAWEYDFCCPT